MIYRRLTLFVIGLCLALAFAAGCGSDDPATPGATDTTAPQVLSTDPDAMDVAVSLDDSVFVYFNEPMAAASAAGNVTMSSGVISGSTWYTDRILVVGHADWAEGTEVTVTVGTGLTDVAGNGLAAPYVFSFWTMSSELLFLASTPADGATGVNRNAGVTLVFSDDVQEASLLSHVTIADTAPLKTVYPYAVDRTERGTYRLTPNATLPASTQFWVTVAAGLAAGGGSPLQDTSVFSFTTGTATDTTPPTVVSADPANGSQSVPADKGYFRVTFSEPMDTSSFEPSAWNLEFFAYASQYSISPTWSNNNTVVTVPLPGLMPAGLPVELHFAGLRDAAGNLQPATYIYEVKVAGAADYLPVVDDAMYFEEVYWEDGEIGNPVPTDTGDDVNFIRFETQLDGTYREVDYLDGSFTTPTGDWEAYRKTASALQWVGFADNSAARHLEPRFGLGGDKDNLLNPPLTILRLPIAVGSWTGNTMVTVTGEGTYTATLNGQVEAQVDLPLPFSGGELFLKDAWRVRRTLAVSLDSEPAFTETSTVWYAATLGELYRTSLEEDDQYWTSEEAWRFPEMLAKSTAGVWGTRTGFRRVR